MWTISAIRQMASGVKEERATHGLDEERQMESPKSSTSSETNSLTKKIKGSKTLKGFYVPPRTLLSSMTDAKYHLEFQPLAFAFRLIVITGSPGLCDKHFTSS